jgi:16S rRNA processing protein RimM
MDKRGLLAIGKILRTHGIRGKLRVLSLLESIDLFFSIEEVQIGGENEEINSFTIRSAGGHGNKAILELEGLDLQRAGELIGKMVWVRRDQLPPLEEGEYYWADLVGMRVYLKDGHSIGIIEQIYNFGSSDIYVCKDGNREILIPATEEVIDRVDLEGKRMVIQEVEGLF